MIYKENFKRLKSIQVFIFQLLQENYHFVDFIFDLSVEFRQQLFSEYLGLLKATTKYLESLSFNGVRQKSAENTAVNDKISRLNCTVASSAVTHTQKNS